MYIVYLYTIHVSAECIVCIIQYSECSAVSKFRVYPNERKDQLDQMVFGNARHYMSGNGNVVCSMYVHRK